MNVLITGTTGLLGTQVVNWFTKYYPSYEITILNDLSDVSVINHLFSMNNFDSVIHLAATLGQNTQGTSNILNVANAFWFGNQYAHRFLFVTPDIYAGELLLKEYNGKFGMNLLVASCTEPYASSDFPFVFSEIAENNINVNKTIPLYTKGQQVPNWFWVENQACAIDILFHQAEAGRSSYTIGGMNAWKRSDLEYNPIIQPLAYEYSSVSAR